MLVDEASFPTDSESSLLINSITKREISVVHAMTALPEAERPRFWHEQFMPLAAEEHALREKLVVGGQNRNPDSKVQ